MRKLLFILYVLSGLGSCQPKEDNTRNVFLENDLPKAIKLIGQKYDAGMVMNPREILLKSGVILVAERKSTNDNKIHAFDLHTKELIKSYGKHGMGPGEITMGYPLLDNMEEESF